MLAIDLKGASKNMEARCLAFERKEKACKELMTITRNRNEIARSKIRKMHEIRCNREESIERLDYKISEKESRLKGLEMKLENMRQSVRVEADASEEIRDLSRRLKDAFQTQSNLQANVLKAMRRKDALERILDNISDKTMRNKNKLTAAVDCMKFQIDRQEELTKSYNEKTQVINELCSSMVELEPNLREIHTHMHKAEVVVCELQEKIKRKEEEIRKVHKDSLYIVEEIARARTEYQVKKERKYRGPEALKQLAQ